MDQNAIHAYFDQVDALFVDLVTRLVAVKSVKEDPLPGMPFGKGPADALAVGLQIAGELGFSTRNVDNYVGVVDLNDQETKLGILCHLDVVGEGVGWSTPPYTVVNKDGVLYGRGVSDDKGPTVASLLAMKAVKDLGIPLKYNARLILGTDEESGSADIAYYFQREPTPPYTFSPDGTFPVINTEKGTLRPEFSKTWTESKALPRVVSAQGGYRLNVIPPESEALVEGLSVAQLQPACDAAAAATGVRFELVETDGAVKILAHGQGGHAAAPEKGNNSITALLALLAGLPLAPSESAQALKDLHSLFPHGDYYGQAIGIAQSDEISGPLTLSFNLYEQTVTGFTGRFDSRAALCATKENSEDVVAAKFAALGYTTDVQLTPPHHTPCDTEFVQTLLAAYEEFTGNKGYCESTGGGTYVHNIEGGVCFGPGMPGDESNAHGADEYIRVKDMLLAAKIFAKVIIEMCA